MTLPERKRPTVHGDSFLIHAWHVLAEGLGSYAAEQMLDQAPIVIHDVASILAMMDVSENWDRHFKALGSEARSWIKELRQMSDTTGRSG